MVLLGNIMPKLRMNSVVGAENRMEYKKWNSVEKKPTFWRYFVYRGRYYYNHSMLFDERLFLLLVDNEHCSSSFDY